VYASNTAARRSFEIDIADPESVRRRIPEISALVEQKREEIRAAQRDFEYWAAVLEHLELIAGEPPKARPRGRAQRRRPTIFDSVVEEVQRAGKPLTAPEITAQLALIGRSVNPKTVSWSLWKANQEGLIGRVGPGLYARVGYRRDDLLPQPAVDVGDRGRGAA
jgi:hypothetical protein